MIQASSFGCLNHYKMGGYANQYVLAISKAQVTVVLNLAKALGCEVEDLIG